MSAEGFGGSVECDREVLDATLVIWTSLLQADDVVAMAGGCRVCVCVCDCVYHDVGL